MEKKLTKSKNKMVTGVCAGIAEYFNIDVTLVRILFVVCGISLLAYLVLAIIMPEA